MWILLQLVSGFGTIACTPILAAIWAHIGFLMASLAAWAPPSTAA
jgi:hypothetical protein